MDILNLNENTVKISISYDELLKMDITFDSLRNDSLAASLFFSMLLEKLDEKFLDNAYVEIFDLDEQGVVIYLSTIPPKKKDVNTPAFVTVETDNIRKLCRFCNSLRKINEEFFENSLYWDGKNYRLVIKIPPENTEGIRKMVNKFKIYARIGELVPSLTKEHNETWKNIIPENAVNILSEGC